MPCRTWHEAPRSQNTRQFTSVNSHSRHAQYIQGRFLTLLSKRHKLKYTKNMLYTWTASASWRFFCFLFRWYNLKPQVTSFLSFLDNSALCLQTFCYGIIHFLLKSTAMSIIQDKKYHQSQLKTFCYIHTKISFTKCFAQNRPSSGNT